MKHASTLAAAVNSLLQDPQWAEPVTRQFVIGPAGAEQVAREITA